MSKKWDSLVIGAGYAGAIVARELAERGGRRVLLLERRNHLGGNAYDCVDAAGVLIHQYGPHIFHTNNQRVFDYLSRFTAWRAYDHRVVAEVGACEMPVPFNLTSLELAFGGEKAARLEKKLIAAYGAEQKVTILQLRGHSDEELKALADYVYENVFVHYTMKQWGQTPEQIDPNTTARVPVFLSRDDRYFQDKFQGMPQDGYATLFEKLLDCPNVTVELGQDAQQRLTLADGIARLDGEVFDGEIIFTGEADALFGFCEGHLPYRTLKFDFETLAQEQFQSHATVNYTVSEDFTRITEFKLLTGQQLAGKTTIVREYARPYMGAAGETPYYAIISAGNNALYAKYAQRAGRYKNLHLLGRLAQYQYYNMDAIADKALKLADELVAN